MKEQTSGQDQSQPSNKPERLRLVARAERFLRVLLRLGSETTISAEATNVPLVRDQEIENTEAITSRLADIGLLINQPSAVESGTANVRRELGKLYDYKRGIALIATFNSFEPITPDQRDQILSLFHFLIPYDPDCEREFEHLINRLSFNLQSHRPLLIPPSQGYSSPDWLCTLNEEPEQLEAQHAELDAAISDTVLKEFLNSIEGQSEELRTNILRRRQNRGIVGTRELSNFVTRGKNRDQRLSNIHEANEAAKWGQQHFESEQTRFEEINRLCQQSSHNAEEISELHTWLEDHSEFGLLQMSDQEYFQNFTQPGYYMHHSRLIKGRDRMIPSENLSGFICALLDGHLMPRAVANANGRLVEGTNFPEATVCFDDDEIIERSTSSSAFLHHKLMNDHRTNQYKNHFSYSRVFPYAGFDEGGSVSKKLRVAQQNLPVSLIAPARILEAHSYIQPNLDAGFLDKPIGEVEGTHFGSAQKDPHSPAHNIDLGCFVWLVPNVAIEKRALFLRLLAEIALNHINETIMPDNETMQQLESARIYLEASKSNLATGDYFRKFCDLLRTQGLPAPRVFPYSVDKSSVFELTAEDIQQGLNQFLESVSYPGPPLTGSRAILTTEDYMNNPNLLPERYRVPAHVVEDTANQVRRILATN